MTGLDALLVLAVAAGITALVLVAIRYGPG
jgi:hypothetical protein